MLSKSLKPHTIEISSKLRAPCRAARQRYQIFLGDQKKAATNLSAENCKEKLNMEMGSLKDKISRLDASINSLNNKFVTLVKNAEGTEPTKMMQIRSEANGLKRKSERHDVQDMEVLIVVFRKLLASTEVPAISSKRTWRISGTSCCVFKYSPFKIVRSEGTVIEWKHENEASVELFYFIIVFQ